MGRFEEIMEWYNNCHLCPRECGANRTTAESKCGAEISITEGVPCFPVARAALHFWEEPCISGEKGSGAVFFSGCSLGCVFCQNREISTGKAGKYISVDRLSDIFFELEAEGANNINLVTAGQLLPFVRKAIIKAKTAGMSIPILYNTSSYEKVEALKSLEGLVDIYLPDMKYMSSMLAGRFSGAEGYPEIAMKAIDEMYRQVGEPVFDENGLIKKGLVVRHLVLPGCTQDSKNVIKYLYEKYGDNIIISIMNQYTPVNKQEKYPVLNRRVRHSEYQAVIDYAIDLGVSRGYMQEHESAAESFIPTFDYTGV